MYWLAQDGILPSKMLHCALNVGSGMVYVRLHQATFTSLRTVRTFSAGCGEKAPRPGRHLNLIVLFLALLCRRRWIYLVFLVPRRVLYVGVRAWGWSTALCPKTPPFCLAAPFGLISRSRLHLHLHLQARCLFIPWVGYDHFINWVPCVLK